jgi:hypothetical protein
MADRLSWLALVAALTFSIAVVMLGNGSNASSAGGKSDVPAPGCCAVQR